MKGQIFCILMLGALLGCNSPDSVTNQNSPVINPPLVIGTIPTPHFYMLYRLKGKDLSNGVRKACPMDWSWILQLELYQVVWMNQGCLM